jgi:hypothetical protein
MKKPLFISSALLKSFVAILAGFQILSGGAALAALDVQQAPCGVLEAFTGAVQLLDSTRTQVSYAKTRAPLPCGSWVSVEKGWAQIRHQNGPTLHLGKKTFIQLTDFRNDPEFKGDHVVLYQGELYAEASGGEEEFRLVSSLGRARFKQGQMIYIFNRELEETQLIALSHEATLENRFELKRKVRVRGGEATSLNFKLLRVVPSLPRAISIASIRPKFIDLEIPESDQIDILRRITKRQGRVFASSAAGDGKVGSPHSRVSEEGLSPQLPEVSRDSYRGHVKDASDDQLHSYWAKKTAGDDQSGEEILFPHQSARQGKGKQPIPHVEVSEGQKQYTVEEDAEKKRLMKELSAIRME